MKVNQLTNLIKTVFDANKKSFDFTVYLDSYTNKEYYEGSIVLSDKLYTTSTIDDRFVESLYYELQALSDNVITLFSVNEAITVMANNNEQNRVQKIFEGYGKNCDEDVHLIDTLGTVYFGNDNANLPIKIMLINMVNGSLLRTSKLQYCFDFIGKQGTGKTSFLKKMAGDYYTDQIMSFSDKDSLDIMAHSLLVNDDEMMVSEDNNQLEFKKFISTTEFSFRSAYARKTSYVNKHFVICRTTNDYSYIKDLTGNRRIIPIIMDETKQTKTPMTITEKERQQILGEAINHIIELDEYDAENEIINVKREQDNLQPLFFETGLDKLNRELDEWQKNIGVVEQENLNANNELVDKVDNYLIREKDPEYIYKKDITEYVFDNLYEYIKTQDRKKIVDILSTKGYTYTSRYVNEHKQRVFVKE